MEEVDMGLLEETAELSLVYHGLLAEKAELQEQHTALREHCDQLEHALLALYERMEAMKSLIKDYDDWVELHTPMQCLVSVELRALKRRLEHLLTPLTGKEKNEREEGEKNQ
jgi:hypothetical protein